MRAKYRMLAAGLRTQEASGGGAGGYPPPRTTHRTHTYMRTGARTAKQTLIDD